MAKTCNHCVHLLVHTYRLVQQLSMPNNLSKESLFAEIALLKISLFSNPKTSNKNTTIPSKSRKTTYSVNRGILYPIAERHE